MVDTNICTDLDLVAFHCVKNDNWDWCSCPAYNTYKLGYCVHLVHGLKDNWYWYTCFVGIDDKPGCDLDRANTCNQNFFCIFLKLEKPRKVIREVLTYSGIVATIFAGANVSITTLT